MKVSSLDDIPSIKVYLKRINAEPRSMRTAVVKEIKGKYWRDVAVIKLGIDNKIDAPAGYEPTEVEAAAIASEIDSFSFPAHVRLAALINLPKMISDADPEYIYEFRDERDQIVMLQQRIDPKDSLIEGEDQKRYVPWTYWDDDKWRNAEPEGGLPLWGLDQLKENSTVFIHEGAKAARTVRRMVDKWMKRVARTGRAVDIHPWLEELSGAAHVGWIGGALSPYRTDWSAIMRLGIKRAYIVSDNDGPGLSAVAPIAQMLRIPTFHLQFTNEFPVGFDLADEFPKRMFRDIGGVMHYVGPSFHSCVHPATWATDIIPQKKGKPLTVLRDHFKGLWSYVEEADIWVHNEMTNVMRATPILNNMLSGFSHSRNTCGLMADNYSGRSVKLSYRPDLESGLIAQGETSAINLHRPVQIKSAPGDATPFLEFMKYLFPIERDRLAMLKWCATLIAKPAIRMEYGVLLISETQGIGKTTLGEKILSPLVGENNTGFPSEADITESNFNEWLTNKRLIVIGEIYSGHSWKAYNRLKGYITDDKIEVNQKFMRQYKIENWIHVFACSNSLKALKIEESDRRWLIPKVTEHKWPVEKFRFFYNWLSSGGLGIIKNWAEGYGDYVSKGEKAPDSSVKDELIRESFSDEEKEAEALAEGIKESREVCTVALKEVVNWTKQKIGGRSFASDHQIKKALMRQGMVASSKRLRIAGTLQVVMISPALFEMERELIESEGGELTDFLKKHMKSPATLMSTEM